MVDFSIRERIESSNQEVIKVGKNEIALPEYLAIRKVIYHQHSGSGNFAFFKVVKGRLQLHVGLNQEQGMPKVWHRFHIIDAREEESERNSRLNIM